MGQRRVTSYPFHVVQTDWVTQQSGSIEQGNWEGKGTCTHACTQCVHVGGAVQGKCQIGSPILWTNELESSALTGVW